MIAKHEGPGHPYGDIFWCPGCLAEYRAAQQKEEKVVTKISRNELAVVIAQSYDGEDYDGKPCEQDYVVADAVLAALNPTPRLVHTLEELEALPSGTVIQEPDGGIGMIMDARDQLTREKRHVVGYPNTLPCDELADVIANTCGDPLTVLHVRESAG